MLESIELFGSPLNPYGKKNVLGIPIEVLKDSYDSFKDVPLFPRDPVE